MPQPPLGGTYHSFDFAKHAHHDFAEAQYGFNRRFDLGTIRDTLASSLRRGRQSKFGWLRRH